jgi:hypothetical protein
MRFVAEPVGALLSGGIVSYRLSGDGRLTRISKVMVMNASGLTFSSGGPCPADRGNCDSQE